MEKLVVNRRSLRVWLTLDHRELRLPRPYIERMGSCLILGVRYGTRYSDPLAALDVEVNRPRRG